MNLDVDMGEVAAELADQVRDLLVENLILKKAVEKMAENLREVEAGLAKKNIEDNRHAEWGLDRSVEGF